MTATREAISRDLIRQCVQCGLCLSSCPTFRLTGSELDSPRGRIFQMDLVRSGEVPSDDPDFRQHMDFCLGCRACESACPSGVQYGLLIEQARATIPDPRPPAGVRLLQRAVTSRRLMRLFGLATRSYQKLGLQRLARTTGLLRFLPASLRQADATLPALEGGLLAPRLQTATPARGELRYRVAMLEGCVMPEFMSETNRATVDVLAANGCDVIVPGKQGCCGALHLHGGDPETARRLACVNIAAFESSGAEYYLTNAAGCGSALKEYGHLLADDPDWAARAAAFAERVRDVQEFLVMAGPVATPGPVHARVTYQDACHLAHGQRVREQPRDLLRAIPGLELVEMANPDYCCGSAGTYNLQQYDASMALLDEKLAAIRETGAEVIAAANPGCIMQIAAGARRAGMEVKVVHPMRLLADAYARSRPAP